MNSGYYFLPACLSIRAKIGRRIGVIGKFAFSSPFSMCVRDRFPLGFSHFAVDFTFLSALFVGGS